MATYEIVHVTEYRYESEVSSSYGEVHLLPRELPQQRCLAGSLTVDPAPNDLRQRSDYFGNRASFFTILVPHFQLSLTATSVVTVEPSSGDTSLFGDVAWEAVRDVVRDEAEAAEFALDSQLVAAGPALAALAAPLFGPGRPILDAVAELSSTIHATFEYEPGATTVTTTLDEVLERRAGVCQDFAHLMIGGLRSLGLAARYVSGYIETVPAPGQERLEGADRSHAWVSVWVPEAGWVDVDPTNDRFVGDRYVTTGWGRDYKDVPPVKGVIFTAGQDHELHVSVNVERVGD
jgi:transglutaminase-like putative cysteine protease